MDKADGRLGSRLLQWGACIVASAAALGAASPAQASWNYRIDILGGNGKSRSFDEAIVNNVSAALDLWTKHLAGGAALEVEIVLDDTVTRASGHSLTNEWLRNEGSFAVYEQGVASEIRTHIDPNADQADLRIQINSSYLVNELWFDPQPALRGAPVPAERTDAVSLLAHELGHALAFNGWWNLALGIGPFGYASTWDANTVFDGTTLYFTGMSATATYGAWVPLTDGNNWHVGNAYGAGWDLQDDLMNGVALKRGTRYDVSPLDLAMLSDMGIALAPVPEPPPWSLLAWGLGAMAAVRRRRKVIGERTSQSSTSARWISAALA